MHRRGKTRRGKLNLWTIGKAFELAIYMACFKSSLLWPRHRSRIISMVIQDQLCFRPVGTPYCDARCVADHLIGSIRLVAWWPTTSQSPAAKATPDTLLLSKALPYFGKCLVLSGFAGDALSSVYVGAKTFCTFTMFSCSHPLFLTPTSSHHSIRVCNTASSTYQRCILPQYSLPTAMNSTCISTSTPEQLAQNLIFALREYRTDWIFRVILVV